MLEDCTKAVPKYNLPGQYAAKEMAGILGQLNLLQYNTIYFYTLFFKCGITK